MILSSRTSPNHRWLTPTYWQAWPKACLASAVRNRERYALTGSWKSLHAQAARGRGISDHAARFTYGTHDWGTLLTAFHEAGHAAAARAHGLAASVEIFGPGEGICYADLQRVDARGVRIIALAGRVAEELAREGLSKPTADLIRFPEDLSGPDRAYAGDFTQADVAATADLIWARWEQISADVRGLMLCQAWAWRDASIQKGPIMTTSSSPRNYRAL